MRLCVETGGTSIRVGMIDKSAGETVPRDFESIPNTSYEDVEASILKYVEKRLISKKITEISVASFGPVGLDKSHSDYGKILSIAGDAKASWSNKSLIAEIALKLGVDINNTHLHTDVTGSAMGELIFGQHCHKTSSLVYITVGTGVGIGVVVGGKPLKGRLHPEGGHNLVVKDERESLYPHFKGSCNYHNNCVENMVSNFSIAERLKCSIEDLSTISDEEPVWDMIAYYLAQLCLSITYTVSPHCIVIGGGILNRKSILPATKAHFKKLNNEYVKIDDLENYIRPTEVNENGLHGCSAFEIDN